MSYFITTYIDENSWSKFGVDWFRKIKYENMDGFVIGKNLPEEGVRKFNELGFNVFESDDSYGDLRDVPKSITKNLPRGERYLFSKFNIYPIKNLIETKDVVCGSKEYDLADLVSSIRNLEFRAEAFKLLANKKLLCSDYVLGTWDFWDAFYVFQKNLYDNKFVELRDNSNDLMINLFFVLTASFTLEIHDVSN